MRSLQAATLAILLVCTVAQAATERTVEVSFLTKGKKVIPLKCRYKSIEVTDIKLPDLVITNRLTQPATPVEIEVVGTSGGERIASLFVGRKLLDEFVTQVNPQIKRQLTNREVTDASLALKFGEITVDAANLSDGAVIKPGQCAVVLLSMILYFHYVGIEKIDGLEIVVAVESAGGRRSITLPVPLTFWESKNRYVFPLRGSLQVANMPMNYLAHRQAHSQEFGLDILQVRPDENSRLATCRKKNSQDLSDYYAYRQEALAAGDGVVVETADAYPEEDTLSPANWSPSASAENVQRLAEKIGRRSAIAGNYVVIQHAGEEFTYYAHLSQGKIRVKAGDKVRAGQVIALVGSTGNSSEPHLHFQLMDSQDMLTANGLPIMFADVPANRMNQYFVGANSLAWSDELYVFLPPREK